MSTYAFIMELILKEVKDDEIQFLIPTNMENSHFNLVFYALIAMGED